ncbi:carA2 [Symbiodinium sp. CCMP2592]|nr:carA2 [Symbiodinium sp. CCMP2592]
MAMPQNEIQELIAPEEGFSSEEVAQAQTQRRCVVPWKFAALGSLAALLVVGALLRWEASPAKSKSLDFMSKSSSFSIQGPENVDSKEATAKMEQSIAALGKMWGFGGHKDKSTDHEGKKENPLEAAQKAMAKAEHSMMAAFKDLTPPKGAAAGSQSQLTNSRPNVQSADKSFVSASEWKKQQKTMNAALDKALGGLRDLPVPDQFKKLQNGQTQ